MTMSSSQGNTQHPAAPCTLHPALTRGIGGRGEWLVCHVMYSRALQRETEKPRDKQANKKRVRQVNSLELLV